MLVFLSSQCTVTPLNDHNPLGGNLGRRVTASACNVICYTVHRFSPNMMWFGNLVKMYVPLVPSNNLSVVWITRLPPLSTVHIGSWCSTPHILVFAIHNPLGTWPQIPVSGSPSGSLAVFTILLSYIVNALFVVLQQNQCWNLITQEQGWRDSSDNEVLATSV